ncbi:hypothetical protein [Solemya elarraichensis gill symbiont]|uniref:Uncharacterized protein n=1 Tax=Solemya elarraichensis gill symbiont TaxID=1918949 RepID=A0A1T2KYN9_9GAMM|nr:hypothetical protein [Solemya elarraichensis gill symbiont]OOZ37931.1 hypothetical protein BOW52_09910 [Solemya elarraichensis gill symbiont]
MHDQSELTHEHMTYEEGMRDGRLHAIENKLETHQGLIDENEGRISKLERIVYIVTGAVALIQAMPAIKMGLATFMGPGA